MEQGVEGEEEKAKRWREGERERERHKERQRRNKQNIAVKGREERGASRRSDDMNSRGMLRCCRKSRATD